MILTSLYIHKTIIVRDNNLHTHTHFFNFTNAIYEEIILNSIKFNQDEPPFFETLKQWIDLFPNSKVGDNNFKCI